MAIPNSASFDYFYGSRPLVTVPRTTGGFDYVWSNGRPLEAQATTAATGFQPAWASRSNQLLSGGYGS